MKSIIAITFLLLCYHLSFPQQVFEINYRLDNKVYPCILIIQSGHTGFIRLKESNGTIHDLDWSAENLYDRDQNKYLGAAIYSPATKDSFLYSTARLNRTIKGQRNEKFASLVIWLRKDKISGSYEPYSGPVPFNTTPTQLNEEWNVVVLNSTLSKKSSSAKKDDNNLGSVKLQLQKNFSLNWLNQFFTPDELSGKTALTVNQLIAARDRNKPTFYLVAVNANEKLCKDDVESVAAYFGELTDFIGIRYKKIFISGADFSVKALTRRLGELKVKRNDIILLTYSGHGFSFREDEQHSYPQLALWHGDAPSQDFLRKNTINLEEVYNMLLAKKAKMTLVLGDCCNSYVEMKRQHTIPQGAGVFPPLDKRWDKNKISRLFLENERSFMIAAAQKGEMAGSHEWYGGFLTYHFLQTVNEHMLPAYKGEPSWQNILAKTRSNTYETSQRYLCNGGICGQRMISKMGK